MPFRDRGGGVREVFDDVLGNERVNTLPSEGGALDGSLQKPPRGVERPGGPDGIRLAVEADGEGAPRRGGCSQVSVPTTQVYRSSPGTEADSPKNQVYLRP